MLVFQGVNLMYQNVEGPACLMPAFQFLTPQSGEEAKSVISTSGRKVTSSGSLMFSSQIHPDGNTKNFKIHGGSQTTKRHSIIIQLLGVWQV